MMTKERRAGMVLADGVPNYAGHSGRFMWKLWIAALIATWIPEARKSPGKTASKAQYP